MRIYNRYIITVSSLLLFTTVLLTALGSSLELYYLLYVIEALVITEVFVHFNQKARSGLSIVSVVLFIGLIIVVSLEVLRRVL